MERSATEEEGQGIAKGVEAPNGESGYSRDRYLQMATKELKHVELSILMGSSCLPVFEEEINKSLWCKRFYELVKDYPCDCGDSHCSRRGVQLILAQSSGTDKIRAATFIAEAANNCKDPQELWHLMEKYQMELYHEGNPHQAFMDELKRIIKE